MVRLCGKITFTQDYRFNPPANENEIAQIGEKLGVVCPEELSQLLLETNGIDDEWGSPLIYSTLHIEERTSEDNKEMGLSYDDMLLFSDAGNGDYFCYIIENGVIQDGIYVGDHEEGSRTKVAASLKEFIKDWTLGEIAI
ncbi:SMI1/KNR4 family protein [Paenibacillus sp. UNC496MF]|uniref:SMI1/KNR4 family protein n=1 Tax=Paenibacillus sp. UNC496MF TaxID=1502753 RepID=UPI001C42F877|nr:SMI1/KNR4 family protein [Paenibacillus sp. UNC496MF]